MKLSRFLPAVASLLSPLFLSAAKWLPAEDSAQSGIRTLACTYDGSSLRSLSETDSAGSGWSVHVEKTDTAGGELLRFVFTAQADTEQSGVAVAFDRAQWSSDNYVMIPASVYNGNRQRIVNRQYATGLDPSDYDRRDLALTSNPIPQLSPEFGAESLLEVSVCNAATPAVTFFDRRARRGVILLTDQGTGRGGEVTDHALIVEESSDRSLVSFVVSAPGVRAKKPEFIGFTDSPDRGFSVKKGDKIAISVLRLEFECPDVAHLLDRFMSVRKHLVRGREPRNLVPMSEMKRIMNADADRRGSRADRWETGWNETNGALMALEIPGIYVVTDLPGQMYVFDHVEATVAEDNDRRMVLKIHNPTEFPAEVTILAEDSESARKPLGDNAFTS